MRTLIHFQSGMLAVALTLGASARPVTAAPRPYDQRDRVGTLARDVSFAKPAEYGAGSPGTTLSLEVAEVVSTFNDVRLRHRAYNKGLVGPTIRVKPGRTLHIKLENLLSPEAPVSHDARLLPHGFNTTNLHTHGLHVSPLKPADDVLLEIAPGSSFQYEFDVPADHPAGTFWYHAHKHGSTAIQLASGMAGALIVEGGLDDAPALEGVQEHILVLQQFVYRKIPGEPAIVHPDDIYGSDPVDPTVAVNGIVTPTMRIRPGEVQRWRLIHAGLSAPMFLRFTGMQLHEIAIDGLTTGAVVARDEVEIHPGGRVDVLIQAPLPERTYVLEAAVRNPSRSSRARSFGPVDIVRLVVEGNPKQMRLPESDELRPFAAFTDADVPLEDELVARRDIKMHGGGRDFLINGRPFDPDYVAIRPELGTAEEWSIIGERGGHPFHIHVNPFAARLPAGDPSPNKWVWRDTMYVEHGTTETFRTRFLDFSGKTVIHCHILDHEDKGMMQAIEIVQRPSPSRQSEASAFSAPRLDVKAPRWRAFDPGSGRRIEDSEFRGKAVLLVLHRGIECAHCATQLVSLAAQEAVLAKIGVQVVAVCPQLPGGEDLVSLRRDAGIQFPTLVDPALEVFQAFECARSNDEPLHGLVLVDGSGLVRWRETGELADLDVSRILAQCRRGLNRRRDTGTGR